MSEFERLIQKKSRLVVGLMSGTSLDGVDVAVAEISGSGRSLSMVPRGFASIPYKAELREMLLRNSDPTTSSVLEISQLNARLPYAYADAVRTVVSESGYRLADIDLIGSHGQTIHHVPDPQEVAGLPTRSTLQIGDPSVLANLLDVPVVGDFRTADMALGGQGAPLVPYFDYVYFGAEDEARGLLNIGGIANLTVLGRGAGPDDVIAFDTGPGNMMVDVLARYYFDLPYDEHGALAARGTVDQSKVADILNQEYFTRRPPKSTGREAFGQEFAQAMGLLNMDEYDALATATALTAFSVYQAYARFVRDQTTLDALIVSGGGVHNAMMMDHLAQSFAPIRVTRVDEFAVDPDAKEALCFAVLAHETVNGVATSLPSVTGATRSAILGKICVVSR